MDSIESIFRWAWYLDYGETPERSLERVVPGSCDTSTSHFDLTIEQLLAKFRSNIISASQAHNIDARGIAGAITWEYEENLRGRYSDYFQYNRFADSGMLFGEGIGWGSVHTGKAREMYPDVSDSRLTCLRLKAESSIELIAKIMDTAATKYFEATGGIWIRNSPPMLAYFFNTSDKFHEESAAKRKLNSCEPGQVVEMAVSANPMAKWVKENLKRFELFTTEPTPPNTHYVTVTTK